MHVDHISLILRLTLSEEMLQRHTPASVTSVGEKLATMIDQYSRENQLGYYPAIEYFRQLPETDQALIDTAEQIAWHVSKLAREEIQSRLRPIFSTVRFQSIQTEAFALPSVRPGQASAFEQLLKHCTPDTVKVELLVSLLRKDADQRGNAAEGYARKMMYRWLKTGFEDVEVTASFAISS
ncbi:MAG: hypothetical protein PVG45_07555 [Gammaproteobacteria bacterium]|jgi:hypothetical protein